MLINMTRAAVLFLLTTEIALAASISTRVRVLENKVGVVERKLTQENKIPKEQLEQIERNTQAIEILTIKVDKTQADFAKISQTGFTKSKSGVAQASNSRFTDDLYSYP